MKRGGCPIRSREVGQGQTADDFQDGRPDLPDVRTPRECNGGGKGGGGYGGRLLDTSPQEKKGWKKKHTLHAHFKPATPKRLGSFQFGDTGRRRLLLKAATQSKVILIWLGRKALNSSCWRSRSASGISGPRWEVSLMTHKHISMTFMWNGACLACARETDSGMWLLLNCKFFVFSARKKSATRKRPAQCQLICPTPPPHHPHHPTPFTH